MCYVYLIQSKSSSIKIGYSDDPHQRLNALKTGSAEKLALRTIIKCRDLPTAQRLESFLHQHYAQYRVNGEWFAIDVSHIVFDVEFMFDLSSSVLEIRGFDAIFEESIPDMVGGDDLPKSKRRDTKAIVLVHLKKHPKDINKKPAELAMQLNVKTSTVQKVQADVRKARNFIRSSR